MSLPRLSPGTWLTGGVVGSLVVVFICVQLALTPPWLGMAFEPQLHTTEASPLVSQVTTGGPAATSALQPGDRVQALAAGEHSLELLPYDLIPEPDVLMTWDDMDRFFERQGTLSAILAQPAVEMTVANAEGSQRALTVTPQRRPLSDLPLVFWMQLLFGTVGFLIGLWVWTLKPDDWGVRMYALTGAMFPVFTHSAAIYSTRELALAEDVFRVLRNINMIGACLFGIALMGIFLCYPRRLVSLRTLGIICAAMIGWIVLGVTRALPNPVVGSHLIIMFEMFTTVVLIGVQWWKTRGDLIARTSLRWFGFWVIFGCGTFVTLQSVAVAAGLLPPIPQGYAFGFFLLMYAGLAFGLRKYRLFDLDAWALRILLTTFALFLLIAFDLALINIARLGYSQSIGITLIVALAYLPMRHWIWDRITRRKEIPQHELFGDVLTVAFSPSDMERGTQWRAMLTRMFQPLNIAEVHTNTISSAKIADHGLTLAIPAVASSPALYIRHPWHGRKLFSPRHARLADTIVQLMRSADQSRDAFREGVILERSRIARDLHDDVSSPILAGLSHLTDDQARSELQQAVTKMRTIVSGQNAAPQLLTDCVADIRYDSVSRLTRHHITVEWPILPIGQFVLQPEQRSMLTSLHHEIVTNIIKHAGATHVDAHISTRQDMLVSVIRDNGAGFDESAITPGQGLSNLRARAVILGGTLRIESNMAPGESGTHIYLEVPLTNLLASPSPTVDSHGLSANLH